MAIEKVELFEIKVGQEILEVNRDIAPPTTYQFTATKTILDSIRDSPQEYYLLATAPEPEADCVGMAGTWQKAADGTVLEFFSAESALRHGGFIAESTQSYFDKQKILINADSFLPFERMYTVSELITTLEMKHPGTMAASRLRDYQRDGEI